MPVTFDNAQSASTNGVALTIAITAAANAVMLAFTFNDTAQSMSTVAYNGVALTRLAHVSPGDLEIWGLTSPAAGVNNLVINITGASTPLGCAVLTYTGAKDVGTFGTAVSQTATTANPNMSISSTTTDIVVGAFKIGGGSLEVKNGTTRASLTATGGNIRLVVAEIAGAASITLSASMSLSQNMQMGGIPIVFSAAAAVINQYFRTLRGVGA